MTFNLKKFSFRAVPIWLWVIICLLVIIRITLPYIGLHVINWALANKLGQYQGSIQDFDLSLYRGAYQLERLEIKKKNTNLAPILSVLELDLSLAWRTLFSGKISGDVNLDRLVVRIMDSEKEEKKQNGTDEAGWQEALNYIVPISIESLKLRNSAFYFTNNDLKVPLPLQIEGIYGHAEDLQSRARKPSESLSPFYLEGLLQGHAKLKLAGKLDALAKPPRFEGTFSLEDFHPKSVNALLLSYVPLDLTSGDISVYGETATAKGEVKGYVNLFLKDVDVIAPDQKILSFKHFLVEIVSAFANWILQTKNEKVLAAHVPFSRTNGKFDVNYGEAFSSAVKNKREPLKKGFDHSISLKNIEGNK